LRQLTVFHASVVLTLVLAIFVATFTYTFYPTVGSSAYPIHYRWALASNPILLTHEPTVTSRCCILVDYSVAREFMGGCLVPRSPFSLPLDSLYTPSYFWGVLW
jgi:hypothetical protein